MNPGADYPFQLEAPAGIAGDLRFRLEDVNDVDVIAETGAGIVEFAAGNYRKVATLPTTAGFYTAVWRRVSTGLEVAEQIEVDHDLADPPPPDPVEPGHYVSLDAIRAELGLDAAALDDTAAGRLRRTAEAIIDEYLGAWPVSLTGAAAGRKIVAADVESWQYAALQTAVVVLAARVHTDPSIAGVAYESVSGPDFSRSKPVGNAIGNEVVTLLRGTGLMRRRTARARP